MTQKRRFCHYFALIRLLLLVGVMIPPSLRHVVGFVPSSLLHRRSSTWCATRWFQVVSGFRPWVMPQAGIVLHDSRQDATAASKTATNGTMIPSTQQLVERRLQVQRAKKEARERSIQQQYERNIQIKRLLHTSNAATDDSDGASSSYSVPPLYAVKVSVCEDLRRELSLNGREKRGRVFIPVDTAGCMTLKGLKQELHSFFRCLKRSSYLLQASLPTVTSDGSIVSFSEDENRTLWKIESDEDVVGIFAAADGLFQRVRDQSNDESPSLKRPSLLVHVVKDPDAPPPPPPPAYLEKMPDPAQSPSMTMLSFYAFPPEGIIDPDEFAVMLKKVWQPFHALGRVYVAAEGVNAQMSIPTNVLPNFMKCCTAIPELGEYMENGINVDPKPLSMEEFAVAGVPVNGKSVPPFRNLHMRVRGQVVADGLDKALDWQQSGYDMPPLEWHKKLKEAKEKREEESETKDDLPVILDCRNTYETDVGRFDGAEPLDTENFRDSWGVLKERLADTPKDAPIMTYCTGGIRCVKVGAYLTQEMGFTNVSRLAGGIIAYDRTLNEKAAGEEPMFKGTNFVFDGRLGREITDDSLGICFTCGTETSMVGNCRNDNCHKRIIQCEKCRTSFHGTCSDACKQRVGNSAMRPQRALIDLESAPVDVDFEEQTFATLEDYSVGHSSPLPSLYHEVELNTRHFLPSGSHMVSGASQGKLLNQFASLSREGRILEFGTFTGYATACFLEGASNAADAMGYTGSGGTRDGGPFVMSMERDDRARNIATAHLRGMCEHGTGEAAAEAICALRGQNGEVPEIKEDIVSLSFGGVAGCELVRVTDALATLEEMAQGKGSLNPAPFDLVFVDADKTRLLEYAEACLSSDRVLKKGGLIVVDNVLWKGLVLEACSGQFSSHREDDDSIVGDNDGSGSRKSRRARKLAAKMHYFNKEIVKNDRAEVVLLPVRDGLSVIRKR